MIKGVKSLLLVFCCAACCGAQTESLTIGPGDLLHVKVLEASELEQSAKVTDAGTFTLILGGTVHVAGLTPPEAALAIERALVEGHYLLTPHVSVMTEQTATQNVTIMGQVRFARKLPDRNGSTGSRCARLSRRVNRSSRSKSNHPAACQQGPYHVRCLKFRQRCAGW